MWKGLEIDPKELRHYEGKEFEYDDTPSEELIPVDATVPVEWNGKLIDGDMIYYSDNKLHFLGQVPKLEL